MLHLRLRVPDDCVDEIVDMLRDDETVTNLAVLPDAYDEGTMVMVDVAREAATHVIARLRELRVHEEGAITMVEIETMLSADADRAVESAPGAPDDGVVWDQVEDRLRSEAALSWAFMVFLTLASLIAGAGRILDQPILIVGSMVVGPEFAPIAAVCLGLALPRMDLIPIAVRTLVAGFVVAVTISIAAWAIAYHLGGAFTFAEATSGPQTDFIVQPDGWSFVVALLAGMAGTLSLTSVKSGPLVGVFIAITTVPAIGTFALCLAVGAWPEAGDALLQLGVNLGGILVAGTITLLIQKYVWKRVGSRHRHRHGETGPSRAGSEQDGERTPA